MLIIRLIGIFCCLHQGLAETSISSAKPLSVTSDPALKTLKEVGVQDDTLLYILGKLSKENREKFLNHVEFKPDGSLAGFMYTPLLELKSHERAAVYSYFKLNPQLPQPHQPPKKNPLPGEGHYQQDYIGYKCVKDNSTQTGWACKKDPDAICPYDCGK